MLWNDLNHIYKRIILLSEVNKRNHTLTNKDKALNKLSITTLNQKKRKKKKKMVKHR